ncbi:MAG: phosphoenolpyruvate--protein phosphotransferase [Clostridia bacterium]|nr:phosphoenolpyruvate--protein phosphotransferase [Clostridia bacterium]
MNSIAKPSLFRGIGIGETAVYGKIRFIGEKKPAPERKSRGAAAEKREFDAALTQARAETSALYRKTLAAAGKEAASIFEIHEMLLCDPDFIDLVHSGISKGLSAPDAVREAGESLAGIFEGLEDEYLSARAADMRDISSRVCSIITGGEDEREGDGSPEIIVCRDLTPGDTVKLDTERVAGFVTFAGSVNSHTAILARAMDIPALIRAEEFGPELDGAPAILDAQAASLSVNPTPEEMLKLAESLQRREAERSRLRTLAALPAVTKSGRRIALYANIGSTAEAEAAYRAGAEGIGLFRSEFLFIGRDDLPGEEEQFEAYRDVASLFADRAGPVVIRTLDIGADKSLPALRLDAEENPALGMRGIRLCLSRPELFRTQIRAILRASAYGKTAIMLPMITCSDEIARTKRIISEEKNRLRFEEVAFDESIGLGIMIETPAAAIMAHELARECDFFSVGTNDLFQYTLAADRQNHRLAYLEEGGVEPVMRLIKLASEGIHSAGEDKWLGICGEMAADVKLTETLLAAGADELSVSPPYLSRIKDRVRGID